LIARNHPAQTLALRAAAGFALLIACFAGDAHAVKVGHMRTQPVDLIVIHSTGGPTCDAATGKPVWVKAGTLSDDIRNIEANPKLGVHYMIDRDGTVQASVPEDRAANHVFKYSENSIGIELINDGDGKDPFPKAQIDALVKLLKDITRRRGIGREGIKRHSDLDHAMLWCDKSQRRKVDPGAAFAFQAVLDRVFKQD
jgi:N-acetylmuramoyl-L-alanine amidase